MCTARVYSGRPLFQKGRHGLNECSGRIHHIVDDQARASLDVSDDVHDLGDVGAIAALVDDRQRGTKSFGEGASALDAARVGRNDRQLLQSQPLQVLHYDRRGEQMVDRNIEEALNLGRMQVQGEHPIRPGRDQ